MLQCSFELNDKPMSVLKVGAAAVPAFSGHKEHRNRRNSVCFESLGPLPPRKYYVFDRQIAGFRSSLGALFGVKKDWFSLYAIDDNIDDDKTLCDHIARGEFRLHPRVGTGTSKGCVTVDQAADFNKIRSILKAQERVPVPGSKLRAYAILTIV